MAKLITLANLSTFADAIKAKYATISDLETLESTVEGLVTTGGEPNVIESISVNGTAQTITDKNVDITVPTAVSELTNDSDYQTGTEVEGAIATAIAATGHASFEVAESVPSADEAEENVLYLVMNSDTGYYDIYALVSGSVVLLDDTSVDLTDYVTTSTLTTTLADYVLASDIETVTDAEIAALLEDDEE